MAVYYRTKCFVFDKKDFGEADQIFDVFSEDFGRIKVLGKAIRKIKSKLRSGIDIFYFSEIEFVQGKSGKILTNTVAIEKFKNIKQDFKKIEIIQKITEISQALVRGEQKDQEIFILLKEAFFVLNCFSFEKEIKYFWLIYYCFFWNLIFILGYRFDSYHCINCQSKLTSERNGFSFDKKGIICEQCLKEGVEETLISPEMIKLLRIFEKRDWSFLAKLKIEEKWLKEFDDFLNRHIFCFV